MIRSQKLGGCDYKDNTRMIVFNLLLFYSLRYKNYEIMIDLEAS